MKRKMTFVIAAMCLGFLLAIALAETALRIHVARRGWTPNCYVTGLAFFVPDADCGQTLRPGLRLRSSSYDVRVNQLGFRGPEIEPVADSNTRRIAVLGGSSVFGYLVPEGQDSCRLLEADLRQRGMQVEVINAGVPGFTVAQCLARYQHSVAKLKPEIVLLYLGWNDSPSLLGKHVAEARDVRPPSWLQGCLTHSVLYGFLRYRLFPPSAAQFAPPVDAATEVDESASKQFDDRLDQLLVAIRESGATPIVCTQLMAGSVGCEGLDAFLGSDRQQIEANRNLSQWITQRVRAAAARNEARCIEIEQCVPCNTETLGDAIHLTASGHRKVADCWRAHLLSCINDSP